ncbi:MULTISPECIES: hypothetical protein [Lysobacter]|jgi:hypothetical protein|uniref:DUF4175 domain-containing protein n=2 Tax=Lysobacter gummosus TaxID=262324 RepID=A0ABY3XIT1_9GAMM|nr:MULTISPECIES: hypothetical protein [Lysobacter]ALN91132.1 hypothetical protein LG3211_2163 [Lysobacter gummosus]MBT2747271.1 hypothetical protein [Lysobacter sp. ISL-42]MBT2753317.1 hypothetical protein [Lysobacter sp. ISL-50]MBT2775427.1 hypothetical protein [Lysobacter sp. ISL-54]MBT2783037.1 hypothetical protein [Lysobacter sp. ISL-52]
MDIVALIAVVAGLYLAFKLVGFLLKAAMWLLVIGGLYWLIAPLAGWPLLG